ncbi:MAG TPA: EcsC family protein [Stellaceae bacterium]|nr:EcsC family protein [Stellaceae bacterium]
MAADSQQKQAKQEVRGGLPLPKLRVMPLAELDRRALATAMLRLERPSLAGRLAALAEKPIAFVGGALPAGASLVVARATERALERALEIALLSLRGGRVGGGRKVHSALASASGALGGAFGFAALAVELPVSTTIMLRAIAAIARAEGEDLDDPAAGLACLEVFALGAPSGGAEGVEAGYFAVRGVLAQALAGAAQVIAGQGGAGEGAALLARFMALVAARFGVVVSEKAAAQAAAVLGAFGGAAINLAFIEHFQELARGHFTVRRLERVYGPEAVRAEYDLLKAEFAAA